MAFTYTKEKDMQEQTLKGKVALITGGSRGLGAATARAFAALGADVALTYVSSHDAAQALVQELQGLGVRALAIHNDQADTASAQPAVQQVLAHFGRLDILVNNAGVAVQGQTVDAADLRTQALDRQWQVNVMGPVAFTRAASQVMADGGRIVFIGSGFGTDVPFAGVADYAGTKAALIGFAKGVARDLGPRNITANVVQPGVMPTDMAKAALGDEVPDFLLDLHAIRRIATLEEVAGLVSFLVGPHGGYITGDVISVSGGSNI